MRKPTATKGTAGHKNAAKYNPNRKHLQSVIIRGAVCQYLKTYNAHLKTLDPIDSDTEILGAGEYFLPFVQGEEIDCRCLGLWDDLPEESKPKHEVADLKPLVEFFRLGGHLNEAN